MEFKAKYSSFLMYKKNSVKCYTHEPQKRYLLKQTSVQWNTLSLT